MWHLTLVYSDTIETYFDSHVDLLQRKLQKHGDRLKMKAEETFKLRDLSIKDLSGDMLAEHFDREFKNFRLKVRAFGRYILMETPPTGCFLAFQQNDRSRCLMAVC